jgi:DsbC/DsbD-like thiol-disulfide interchange protein
MMVRSNSGGGPVAKTRTIAWRYRFVLIAVGTVCVLAAAAWTIATSKKSDDPPVDVAHAPIPLTVGNAFRIAGDPTRMRADYRFSLTNNGTTTVTITNLGRSGAGLDLLRVRPQRTELAPGKSVTVTLTYRVSGCASVTRMAWPLPITARASGRTTAGYVDLRSTGPHKKWQQDLSDVVCRPQG